MNKKLIFPCMKPFVFSHDAHVNEPSWLFEKNLGEKWKHTLLHTRRDEKYLYMLSGDKLMHRMQLGDGWSFRGDNSSPSGKVGGWDIEARLHDMAIDGVDAAIVYSSLTGFAWALDPEPGKLHMQAFNDWCINHFKALPNTFVPCAQLPAWNPEETARYFENALALGYRAVMLPMELLPDVPQYNDASWEPVWALAEAHNIPITLHLSTGGTLITERGAGAACMNYFNLGLAALHTVAQLISSGALDRHPALKFVITETGANWLTWVGERLDEVYTRHDHYVKPKLTRMPSEILYGQVLTTTHREQAWIRTRAVTGLDCILWSNDFPHKEGTFPESKEWIEYIFAGSDMTPAEKYKVLGGNAIKLYGLDPDRARAEKAEMAALEGGGSVVQQA